MRILFVHQNFPAQFKHLAPALARSHSVRALTLNRRVPKQWEGVEVTHYAVPRGSTPGIAPAVASLETQVIRGEAAFLAALKMREEGCAPDLIVAHPGWGESLFLKDVWPDAKLGIYCEFYYHPAGYDVGFDAEFATKDPLVAPRLRLKNANYDFHFRVADAALAPTRWQASTFPAAYQERITVVHDGIDTVALQPNAAIQVALDSRVMLSRDGEVITFVNRNLEPYRGFHIFMRALPALLKARPRARVLIVGGDDVSYGARPAQGSWKDCFAAEVRPRMSEGEWSRIHFLGKLAYKDYAAVMQLSTVHVYLTYPFVLSWSLLEAMSLGCAIVASDTPPVREVIQHDETGRLVDFFDVAGLTAEVLALLEAPAERERLGSQARLFVQQHYDLKTVCLPRQLAWIDSLASLNALDCGSSPR